MRWCVEIDTAKATWLTGDGNLEKSLEPSNPRRLDLLRELLTRVLWKALRIDVTSVEEAKDETDRTA